jgi:pimeloyl-ACP methyl ester carboxylesterase
VIQPGYDKIRPGNNQKYDQRVYPVTEVQTQKNIYYHTVAVNREHKNKPWLTMIHGFSQTHHYFSAQVPIFQQDFRLFLADLRGHGQSTKVEGPYGIEEYAGDVISVLDNAGIEKTHYWGTHTGAAIGLVLALRHPERFTSLILEGTFLPGFPMPRAGELIDRARSIARSKGLAPALADWFDHADWFAYMLNHPQVCRAKEHRAMIFEFSGMPWLSDLTPRQVTPVAGCLAEIQQSTLIYNGQYDLDDFKQAARHLETDLPNAQREEISEAGGFPGWENPQAVNLLVCNFLTRQRDKNL